MVYDGGERCSARGLSPGGPRLDRVAVRVVATSLKLSTSIMTRPNTRTRSLAAGHLLLKALAHAPIVADLVSESLLREELSILVTARVLQGHCQLEAIPDESEACCAGAEVAVASARHRAPRLRPRETSGTTATFAKRRSGASSGGAPASIGLMQIGRPQSHRLLDGRRGREPPPQPSPGLSRKTFAPHQPCPSLRERIHIAPPSDSTASRASLTPSLQDLGAGASTGGQLPLPARRACSAANSAVDPARCSRSLRRVLQRQLRRLVFGGVAKGPYVASNGPPLSRRVKTLPS